MESLTEINTVRAQDGAFLIVGADSFNDCIKDLNLVFQRFAATKLTLAIGEIPLNTHKNNSAAIFYKKKTIGNVRIVKAKEKKMRGSSRRRNDYGVDYAVGLSSWKEVLLMGYFNIVETSTKTAKRNSDAMRDAFVEFAKTMV